MRKAVAIVIVAALSAPLASAQMKVQPKKESPVVVAGAKRGTNEFARISQADALKLYKSGKAVFIDVRSNEQYKLGHIRNALSIPGSQMIRRFKEVTPGKTVITYCACSAEQSSGRAAADLGNHGVKNVFALKGGYNEWKANGHPIAIGEK